MSLRDAYVRLRGAALLSQERADEIVAAARPMALVALGRAHDPIETLDVVAAKVDPVVARGGSLIPAWPQREPSGRVIIEFVADWGVMLSAWHDLFDPDVPVDVDDLLESGQRVWIGIANDVLQLFVPEPPPGAYSMVRHHALMLVAATLWLGSEATRRWQAAHVLAARWFLRECAREGLWPAIEHVEAGLKMLVSDARSRWTPDECVAWLDGDANARAAYQAYLGAASLGIAALLESEPVWTPNRLSELVCHQHQDADFNRSNIERFAMSASSLSL